MFILIGALLLFPILIYYSSEIADGVANGIKVCFNTIIPSLYIFTVLSIFCVNSELFSGKPIQFISKILNASESCGSALFLSLFCGYPIGARLINELYKKKMLNRKTAELLTSISINPGPAFVISAIGVCIYKSKAVGSILFASAVFTPILLALFLRKHFDCYNVPTNKSVNYTNCFLNAVSSANKTLASICGWVILGSVAVTFAENILNCSFIACFLEVSVGVIEASKISIYLVSFLIGFGGICVQLQALSAASDIKPRFWLIFIIKLICGVLNATFTYLLLKVFKVSVQTVNINNLDLQSGQTTPLASIMLMLFVITTLTFLQRKLKNYGK